MQHNTHHVGCWSNTLQTIKPDWRIQRTGQANTCTQKLQCNKIACR